MSKTTEIGESEQDLWNAFREGSETAFAAIARSHYRSLFGYGIKFSSNREFVKDCIQDLLMDLWAKRESIGDTAFVKFYLFKSLRRKIHRESLKNKWVDETADLDFEANYPEVLSVEQELINTERSAARSRKLSKILASLPKRQQEVIYLKFFEDLDNDSIAEVMSISKQSVANLIYRTIRDLKAKI